MSELQWRMPQPDELPQATLRDGLNVADVAEVLDRDERSQLRAYNDLLLLVVAETDARVLVRVLLVRNDDSFVWRVHSARAAGATDGQQWMQRGDQR
ncbi:hypothetical protein Drose_36780 [Dactylosporangium roseum]|uniref:Uncharacterized protein n=1 Tax=Dactylosporangium roseum TaxID=47989 RepID=A0ABY5Z7Z9_9ACTN|nr:hypothetical protein [Dactylosporangium roseum]UWZ36509.1 hypothetical protein Drose_36780 [Dactylosporangium roseum]